MKKRSITLTIWLMSIAIVGVMAMQYYFIQESYKQKSQLFDEAVMASLSNVAGKIERKEVVDFARFQQKTNDEKNRKEVEKQKLLAQQVNIQEKIQEIRNQQYEFQEKYRQEEQQLKALFPDAVEIENSFFETYIRRPQYAKLVRVYWHTDYNTK